jgi:phage shock protein C
MVCETCSRSFDGVARFCTGCGRTLHPPVAAQEPLKRSRFGRMIAGVCAGIAQTYNLDVTLVRLLVCLAACCSAGTAVFVYIILWIIMPVAPYAVPPQTIGVTAS